jgi:hypothetical protein
MKYPKSKLILKLASFAITVGILNLHSTVHACIAMPEEIDLEGASFSGTLKMGLDISSVPSLAFAHSGQRFYIGPAMERKENRVCITVFEPRDTICTGLESNEVNPAKAKARELLEVKNTQGKIVGIIQFSPGSMPMPIMVWSVDSSGKIDRTKPYLRIDANSYERWKIEAIEKGTTLGFIDAVASGVQYRSVGLGPTGGKVNLRGRSYTTTGSGCSGKLTEVQTVEPTGVLMRNGVPVSSPGVR